MTYKLYINHAVDMAVNQQFTEYAFGRFFTP